MLGHVKNMLGRGSKYMPFLNGPSPASFKFIFSLFKTNYKFYNKSMWKNVYQVHRDGIRTHDLHTWVLLPWPLDQSSHPGIYPLIKLLIILEMNYSCSLNFEGNFLIRPFPGFSKMRSFFSYKTILILLCWSPKYYLDKSQHNFYHKHN